MFTAKTFSRPFASFALVSSSKSHPLTSNVMLVNKDGDLELYAVHDTPVHPAWSARGDLALGVGCSYTVVPGITDMTRPLEPWEILAYPSRPGSHAQSLERPDFGVSSFGGRRSRLQSESPSHSVPPPTFGRGDEEGFPALSPRRRSLQGTNRHRGQDVGAHTARRPSSNCTSSTLRLEKRAMRTALRERSIAEIRMCSRSTSTRLCRRQGR